MIRCTYVLAAVVLVLALVSGCRPRTTAAPFDPKDAAAEAERLEKYLRRHPKDQDAWRDLAHIRWQYLRQTDRAIPILERLARAGDPVASASRMIIAEGRLDLDTLSSEARRLLQGAAANRDPDARALWTSLAEVAARFLTEYHGERPADIESFLELYAKVDLSRLPVESRQPLMSLRASIARQAGDDYRKYYRAQGCVQAWAVGEVEGTAGALELETRKRARFTLDPEAQLSQLACVVRVWNPTKRAGIRRLRTFLEVRDRSLQLDLSAKEPMRVYLDGKRIHRTDRSDRWPARRVLLELSVEPGTHQLDVVTAVPGRNAWVLVRATDQRGTPIVAKAKRGGARIGTAPRSVTTRVAPWPEPLAPVERGLYAPLRSYLAVADALADGDTDRAERRARVLGKATAFAEGQLMVARFERADPSRGKTASATRERRSLAAALELSPALDAARLRTFELRLDRGEDEEVLRALAKLPKGRLRGVRGQLFRWRAYLAQGSEYLAERALAQASRLHPQGCDVLVARRSMARQRDNVTLEDELADKLSRCAGTLKLRARLAQQRQDHESARELWNRSLTRVPDDVPAIESLAQLAVMTGDVAEARKHLARVIELDPDRLGAYVALADLHARDGDVVSARAQIEAGLARVPHSRQLRAAGEMLGVPDDLWSYRIDGRQAFLDYKASGVTYEGVNEVYVLDRAASRVYDGGGQRQLVHLVVHLLSKEALDRYGEIRVPDGAQLLTLQTIKPDGTLLEPEAIAGKDALSLRHLEVGDAVDFEYVIERPPTTTIPGYVEVSTFRFQALDTPYHRSEIVVVHPQSIELREERRNNPPKPTVSQRGSLVVRHWRAEAVARLGVEPGHRALLDEVPSIRVYTDLDVEAWLSSVALQVRTTQRTNPELRRLVARLTRKHKSARAKLNVLWRWVLENIEDATELTTNATVTLAAGEGSRMTLLRAMLRAAGVRAELWFARNAYGPERKPGGHPMVESFDTPMLAVHLPKRRSPVMVVTSSKVVPLGYLAPAFSGTAGLRVHLDAKDGPPGPVALPSSPRELADRRSYDLSVDVDASGNGTLTGTIELQGMEAVAWRQTLREIDRDRVHELFQQVELTRLVDGATVTNLDIEHERDLRHPLRLTFEADARGVGVKQGGALVLPSALVPMNYGVTFTALPKRRTGVVVPYAPLQEARVALEVRGAAFTAVPAHKDIRSKHGTYEREITAGGVGKRTLEIRMRSTLRPGVVAPAAYPDLASFTRDVEAAEQDVIRAK